MPKREAIGDVIYHVLNRANGRMQLFETDGDYDAFMKVLAETHDLVPTRILSYCVMPNHWHLVLWPRADGELSAFMHRLTMTHAKRWHAFRQSTGTGHIYQGPFKSFPVESDMHYLTVCRYVEANALRAGLTPRAETWRWGSAWARLNGSPDEKGLLSDGLMPWPDNWLDLLNEPQPEREEGALQRSIQRGAPFGNPSWVNLTSMALGLTGTLRPRGRPKLHG